MAYKRLKRCKAYGCPNLHYNANGYCDSCYSAWKAKHPQYYKADGTKKTAEDYAKEYDAKRGTARQRGYDTQWQKFARQFLRLHPTCALCGAKATVCDHKTDTAKIMMDAYGKFDYSDVEADYQALCARCNAQKGIDYDKAREAEYFTAKKALGIEKKND